MVWNFNEVRPLGDVDANWVGPAFVSTDGSKIWVSENFGDFVTRIFYSSNSGASWAQIEPVVGPGDHRWSALAVSSDFSKILAGIQNGRMYYSSNYGVDWAEIQPAGDISAPWTCACIAENGTTFIAACQSGELYYSTNSGTSWVEIQPSARSWSSGNRGLSLSSDGTKIFASSNDKQYYSSDSGSSWIEVLPVGSYDSGAEFSYMSSDGTKLLISLLDKNLNTRHLYYSSNSGSTWVDLLPNGVTNSYWSAAGVSSDLTKLMVVSSMDMAPGSDNKAYYSSDSGSTWTQAYPDTHNWYEAGLSNGGDFSVIGASWATGTRLYYGTLEEDPPTTTEAPTTTTPGPDPIVRTFGGGPGQRKVALDEVLSEKFGRPWGTMADYPYQP